MSRDLLDKPGGAGLADKAVTLTGYHELASGLGLSLAEGWTARLWPQPGGALLVEADLPPWFSLEAWLGDGQAEDQSGAEIEVSIRAERDFNAGFFVRTVSSSDVQDGPATPLRLGQASPVRAQAAPVAAGRQRAILLLRDPPARFTLDRLQLTSAPGSAPP